LEIKLEVANDHEYSISDNLSKIVEETLEFISFQDNTIISLAFIDEDEISTIYNEYFGYAQSTDVLSFNSNTIDPETGFLILGEILICYPFVEIQANNLKNSIDSEISLLIVHGLLHLLGYDHIDDSMKNEMWTLQTEILKKLNISMNSIPE
jgi:probable rRNA maturation factor